MSTLLANPNIKVDGDFSDWVSSERIDNPGNSVPGYELFGTVQNDTYLHRDRRPSATDPVDRRRHHDLAQHRPEHGHRI